VLFTKALNKHGRAEEEEGEQGAGSREQGECGEMK